jgi:hypothetical protein
MERLLYKLPELCSSRKNLKFLPYSLTTRNFLALPCQAHRGCRRWWVFQQLTIIVVCMVSNNHHAVRLLAACKASGTLVEIPIFMLDMRI